ncbi:MAG: hypothetical protein VX640_16335 [Pseudomonadota bacterium]|nr:hypothetical protein [Pseudomonadota bacterium]
MILPLSSLHGLSDSAPRQSAPTLPHRQGRLSRLAANAIVLYTSAVFLDSLRFKFSNAPKTQIIFSDLDAWAGSFGLRGIFSQTGLFSQHIIGGAELIASAILLGTMLAPRYRFLQPLGAMLGLGVMSGAISFHLFTPLGVNVDGDHGALFFAACGVWIGCALLLFLRRRELSTLRRRLSAFLAPDLRR